MIGPGLQELTLNLTTVMGQARLRTAGCYRTPSVWGCFCLGRVVRRKNVTCQDSQKRVDE